ncbi:MAG: hypothetical protein DRO23_06830 [Thermoprotei archaeon]|nr:MAG: hypothetical protein DRO23_06830 [Thermoprotei archaeon]
MKLDLKILLGNYKYVELSLADALNLLIMLEEKFPDKVKDITEVRRIIKNFDVFYDIARRKFKDYILIPHVPSDMLRGRVLFDKVKLIREGNARKIGLFFDKNIELEDIVRILSNLGFEINVIESFI